jgi:hypothetical protein
VVSIFTLARSYRGKIPKIAEIHLGDRIQSGALDVLERLIEATYSRQALPILMAANLGLEKLRLLFRLANDLYLLDLRRYEFAARVARNRYCAVCDFVL